MIMWTVERIRAPCVLRLQGKSHVRLILVLGTNDPVQVVGRRKGIRKRSAIHQGDLGGWVFGLEVIRRRVPKDASTKDKV